MVYYKDCELFFQDGEIRSKTAEPIQACHQTSHKNIVDRRGTEFHTPCGRTINDFVAFYFSTITAMAYSIHKGNVPLVTPDGEDKGPATMDNRVFFICDVEKIAQSGLPFYFTDVACNTSASPPTYETDIGNIETHIDWELFDEQPIVAKIPEIGYDGVTGVFRNLDTPKYSNRKHKRQAEFLVQDRVPLDLVECIVVKSNAIKAEVEAMMVPYGLTIPVYTKMSCYF
jgi:hypothetical protein